MSTSSREQSSDGHAPHKHAPHKHAPGKHALHKNASDAIPVQAAACTDATVAAGVDAAEIVAAARAQRLLPACLAVLMSCLVAAVVTAVNTGLSDGYPLRWMRAWAIAGPVAIAGAYLFRSWAWWMARKIAR